MDEPLWRPSPRRAAGARLRSFERAASRATGRDLREYRDLHRWSVDQAPEFWALLWDWAGIVGERGERRVEHAGRAGPFGPAGPGRVLPDPPVPDLRATRFLPDARLNFTENLLRGDDDALAIVAVCERGTERRLTFAELRRKVASVAEALQRDGVTPGDRVAGIVANTPEAVIAALGTIAIGAVWSSCSPDFGVDGIVDRFGQIEPVVLLASEQYDYGGRTFDCRAKTADVASRLPSVRRVIATSAAWNEWVGASEPAPIAYERFPFHHPIYILYSSGTTGVPKCIVHGAGGTLLQHVKELALHYDVKTHDRVFYFTTCGWMMWNWLVSTLACDAAIVLYDGSPFHPDGRRLFTVADDVGVTLFGVSARFLDAVKKAGLEPRVSHRLSSVRTITSTGSPLLPETFDFVYRAVKSDVHLASLSGGTDIVSCFMGGNPTAPVWRGELQAPGLGMDVRVFDDEGRAVVGAAGELVCAAPFPSMPVAFWNDADGSKYARAYFERFPGVWCHGDWVTETSHGGFVIHGRSDTTLNPGGVRIGTAEIYRQVEHFPEILESIVVGQPWQGDERVVLFVRMAEGYVLDDALRARIGQRLRRQASPRHVPARIVAVPDLPRTRSGKLVEVAVRRMVQGLPVPNVEALANPECLAAFRSHPELAT